MYVADPAASAAAAAPALASAAYHGSGSVGGGAAAQAENSSPEQTTIAIVTRPFIFFGASDGCHHTPRAMRGGSGNTPRAREYTRTPGGERVAPKARRRIPQQGRSRLVTK